MKFDVFWPEPKPLDHFMLKDIFDGLDWKPYQNIYYNIVDDFTQIKSEGFVYIVHGANTKVQDVNKKIAKFKWVLLILVSDEENLFEIDKLDHPNLKIWVQTPRAGKDYGSARFFGVGYGFASKYRHKLGKRYLSKPVDVFISGQNTHPRRKTIFEQLNRYQVNSLSDNVEIFETEGFTQGMEPESYYVHMASTKIAPAPSGIVSPDSFRLYEALELGAIPIADDLSPRYDSKGYWSRIFPDAPFPILQDDDIASLIDQSLENYQEKANKVFAWWIAQKRRQTHELTGDILGLSGADLNLSYEDKITVIVPVSPWKSHPNTEVLEKCLNSVRSQLPNAEIIVTFDGVRREQQGKKESYQEFTRRALWLINTQHKNVLPVIFSEHAHQSGMMKEVLKQVKTEYVLYMEGDMAFYEDRPVPWDDFVNLLDSGRANILRVHFNGTIPEAHDYLMYHERDMNVNGNSYVATSQWSQRPHLMSRDMYSQIMRDYFSPQAKCFIEDRFYYIIHGQCDDGLWDKWKMFIYLPKEKISMAHHLDGRDGETKYDKHQIW